MIKLSRETLLTKLYLSALTQGAKAHYADLLSQYGYDHTLILGA